MRYKCLIGVIATLLTVPAGAAGEELPKEIRAKLVSYDVTRTQMSRAGSMESMPVGNGDITANVWVEEGGDLLFYIGKSDTWSEAGRLLKVGRVRVHLTPNPFVEGASFSQCLHLHDGSVSVHAAASSGKVDVRLWVDANQPAVRVEVKASRPVSVEVSNDGMRPERKVMDPRESDLGSFRGVYRAPFQISEDPDLLLEDAHRVVWAHHNTRSFQAEILRRQHAEPLVGKYPDIYLNRTFGAALSGKGWVRKDVRTLVSERPGRSFSFQAAVLTLQGSVEEWEGEIRRISDAAASGNRKAHAAWWEAFWNRSWIFVSGDAEAEELTRAWLLQRYMMACQGRGAWPVKFNGGSVTFDYDGYDADYRRWGPGFWHQNQRLMYWPLIASGDMDLLKPWFDYYRNLLDFQTEVTRLQFGHGGAYFPETMNPFGLYIQDDWGWDNPGSASETRWIRYHWSGGLEMLAMMLDAYSVSGDASMVEDYIVPMANGVLTFFQQHWPRIGHTIRFIPANSIEQFWDCLNPTDYIAGIRYDIRRLRELLPSVPDDLQAVMDDLEAAVPAIPVRDGRILPAEEFGAGRNAENPELYAVFPFRLYRAGDEVALRTYAARVFHESNACWSQDNIQAALLGLPEDAAAFCLKKARTLEPSGVTFPGFWKAGGDWIPDLDNGGSLAMGLQYMLLGPEGQLLPAWPERWAVDFKLHAAGGRTVRYRSGFGEY
ncbi:MAG: hypothetical protein IJ611_09835 [Bacteroidales bacterium]|nr:hypothetical protein [Bacteroidales bacterium]